jgi:hypothetical protein
LENLVSKFAFKWVNLYRYGEGVEAVAIHGGALHVEFI